MCFPSHSGFVLIRASCIKLFDLQRPLLKWGGKSCLMTQLGSVHEHLHVACFLHYMHFFIPPQDIVICTKFTNYCCEMQHCRKILWRQYGSKKIE